MSKAGWVKVVGALLGDAETTQACSVPCSEVAQKLVMTY